MNMVTDHAPHGVTIPTMSTFTCTATAKLTIPTAPTHDAVTWLKATRPEIGWLIAGAKPTKDGVVFTISLTEQIIDAPSMSEAIDEFHWHLDMLTAPVLPELGESDWVVTVDKAVD